MGEEYNPGLFLWGEQPEEFSWTICVYEDHRMYLNDYGDQVFCKNCGVLWWEQNGNVRADRVPALEDLTA